MNTNNRLRQVPCLFLGVLLAFTSLAATVQVQDSTTSASDLSAQQPIGWFTYHVGDFLIGAGFDFPLGLFSGMVMELGGSPYKAYPYAQFGLTTAILERTFLGIKTETDEVFGDVFSEEREERFTLLPLYIHYTPYMRYEKWSVQPVTRTVESPGYVTHYYDPSRSEDYIFAYSLLDVYLGGSSWASTGTNAVTWYLRFGARWTYYIKLDEKPIIMMDILPIGIDVGILYSPQVLSTSWEPEETRRYIRGDRPGEEPVMHFYASVVFGVGNIKGRQ